MYSFLLQEIMMKNSEVKLHYFNFMGRGEIIRMLLVVGGQKFENHRITDSQWPEFKKKCPYGQLPCLEIDGKFYAQSVALANLLAREFGLYGSTIQDALMIDTVMQLIQDLLKIFLVYFDEKDPHRKAELAQKLKDEDFPRFCRFFENILQDSGTGFVVGNKLSLADIALYELSTGMVPKKAGPIDEYPRMKALMEKVGSLSTIKDYMDSRPVTDY